MVQELACASLFYPTVVKQEEEQSIDAPEAKVDEEVAPERLPAECREAIVQNMIVHPGAV